MKTMRAPRIPALLLPLLLLAGAVVADPCPEEIENGVRVDVVLDWESSEILVDPETVEIHLEEGPDKVNRVCWVVEGLQPGQLLTIAGKEGEEDPFPGADRKLRPPRTFINSGRPNRLGSWSYDLIVTDQQDETVLYKDPVVIIKP